MRTYTEKPRTEVDWKGFAYDPFLDGSSRISVGLVATRLLMCRITGLGVPVAAEPLNALTPQYVNGLVTYNGVGARNVTDQTARERVSGFSRSEEHTSELQSRQYLVCRLLLEKKTQ